MIPRASFVIPAYNVDRWLSKAIWSCRNQTIKQIEIVVVNDGSTDETQHVLNWHAKEDPRVVPIHLLENAGRSNARNLGNDRASSPLILVLDSDDLATRNRVKDTLTTFQLKKPDFMFGSFFVIDSMGTTLTKRIAEPFDPKDAKEKKLNFICHSTSAYTKELSRNIRYEDGPYSKLGLEDWKFQWDAHNKGYKFQHLKTPLCYYRQTDDGTMATRDEKAVAQAKEAYFAA